MKQFIFYTTEGYTESPTNAEVGNCQLLGTARGTHEDEALQNLLAENQWIEEQGFSPCEIMARQLLSEETKHDVFELLNYLWENEERHYEETGRPSNHIFEVMKNLKAVL